MRRKTVHIKVSSNFYDLLERRRQQFQKKIGFRKNITQTNFTELLMKSGLKLPKINLGVFKNDKRKKG